MDLKKTLALISVIPSLLVASSMCSANSWYIGGGFGRSYANVHASDFFGSPSINRFGIGGKAFVGYQFNQNFSTEFTYLQPSAIEIPNQGDIRTRILELSGVGTLPISQQFSLGASGGVFLPSYGLNSNILYVNGKVAPRSEFGFGYGAFLQYALVPNAYLRGGWDQVINRSVNNSICLNSGLASIDLVINLGSIG